MAKIEKEQLEIIKLMAKKHEHVCSLVTMEECGELIHEVSKFKRGREHNLVEEMADMYICLEFMKEIARINDSDLEQMIDSKCRRMLVRDRNNKFF